MSGEYCTILGLGIKKNQGGMIQWHKTPLRYRIKLPYGTVRQARKKSVLYQPELYYYYYFVLIYSQRGRSPIIDFTLMIS